MQRARQHHCRALLWLQGPPTPLPPPPPRVQLRQQSVKSVGDSQEAQGWKAEKQVLGDQWLVVLLAVLAALRVDLQ